MSEYPEHIDQIDDFYRSQLADHEIEPPEGLWDKISLSALETQNQEVKVSSASSRFTNTQKYVGLLAGSILLITGAFYFYNRKQELSPSDQDAIPVIEQSADPHHSSSPKEGTEERMSPSQPLKEKTTTSDFKKEGAPSGKVEIIETPANDLKVETPEIIQIAPQEQKADSIEELKTMQKTPKEKVKFKDKYKKEYQDSTRKIFVPGK